jgi:hypothetical protein
LIFAAVETRKRGDIGPITAPMSAPTAINGEATAIPIKKNSL